MKKVLYVCIAIALFYTNIVSFAYSQQVYPTGNYRVSANNAPGIDDSECIDPGFCQCWLYLDMNLTNNGPAVYDVSASLTCRGCSYIETWPNRKYDVSFGDIPANTSTWGNDYFAYFTDACIPGCASYTVGQPCWTIRYRTSPEAPLQVYENVPWTPEWGCLCGETTIISLASFRAVPSNAEVTLEWITESEIDNAGFNIYRSESEEGEYTRINTSLIAAKGSPMQGAAYSFVDREVKNRRTYYYKLEDVDLNGIATIHNSINATPRIIH